MKYPLEKAAFVSGWVSMVNDPDPIYAEYAAVLADALNSAYYAGVADGRGGVEIKGGLRDPVDNTRGLPGEPEGRKNNEQRKI